MNQNVLKAKNKFVVLLVVFIIAQCFAVVVLLNFAKGMSEAEFFDEYTVGIIKRIILIGAIILSIIGDAILYTRKIRRLTLIAKIQPNWGRIEDFIIYSYGKDGNRRIFKIAPIIRNSKDNNLYVTYGDYSASWYTTIEGRNMNTLICKEIIRSDGSVVKKGDNVVFYVIKPVNLKIEETNKKHWFKLNGKQTRLELASGEEVMKNMKDSFLFEGAVDVDTLLNQ